MRLLEGEEVLSALDATRDENSDFKLMQFEFVHAVLRLAKARFGGDIAREEPSPLASCLDLLMTRCVLPNLTMSISDEITELMQSRRLRAVLARHQPVLRQAFDFYCGLDLTDGANPAERPASKGKAKRPPKRAPSPITTDDVETGAVPVVSGEAAGERWIATCP